VRRFEYIGGGSEKFWAIDRAGASVTVHFGRIGTAGQTQVKDLGTDQAANAHVAELIAEKVKKGYVENGSPAPAVVAAPEQEVGAPPAPAPADPDREEDAWTAPPAWLRHAEPFRGRAAPARATKVDPEAPRVVDQLMHRVAVLFQGTLDNPASDAGLVERARLHLGTSGGRLRRARQETSPLGAAAVAAVIAGSIESQDRERLPAIADDWVITHGAVLAAEAGALLAGIRVFNPHSRQYGPHPDNVVAPAVAHDLGTYHLEPVLGRLRALLAAAGDADYAAAVDRLEAQRSGVLAVRLATSYLAPTEQRWLDEDLEMLRQLKARGSMPARLLASVTTAAQARMFVDGAGIWPLARSTSLPGIAARIGPEVAPILAEIFDANPDADTQRRVATMLGELPTDEAFGLLVDRLDQKYVAPAVMEAMGRFPRRAMRMLAEAAAVPKPAARELLRGHAISRPDLAARVSAEVSPAAAKVLDGLLDSSARVPEAAPDQIPAILVTPPWANRRSRPAPAVVPGIRHESPVTLRWKPGEREEWAQTDTGYAWMLGRVGDWDATVRRAVAGGEWRQVAILALAPEELVRPRLAHAEPSYTYDAGPSLRRLLGRFGDDAIPYALRVVLSRPTTLAPVLLPFAGSEMTARMADWYARSKSIRPVAMAWLERHAAAAARDLVALALGTPGKERSTAESALRLLDQRGHTRAIREAAALGPSAAEGIDAMLALDPLDLLPARIPALPAWLDPAHLPQVLLPDRRNALPTSAVGHLCTMLAMCKPGDTYAGVEIVRDAVDPLSAAEMAWGIFERWQSAGYPTKGAWVLDALGLLGDDETVRRLAPLIRAWPGEAAHKRAVTGLDVLSAIGTDVALMHLHGIAEKAKFAGLKSAARAKMDEVAESLGLSAEQLADRLVPDFGLDADGAMVLDYGERRFRVGFDEQLKPVVADEDGSRRKLLPKPGAKDDPSLAPAAYARFAGLKKDVKTVAADQIRRFERAMVNGRRWTAAEQRTLFVDHPLLRHLTRRLVWATFDGEDRPTGSFRVAEDQTLADANDDELTVAGDTAVGIAHPLHLGETLGAWSDVFADYEILQPFPQLGREVLALTPEERSARLLPRFAGATVYTGKILGLSHRGWQRGSPQDAGVSHVAYKLVPGGRAVVVDLDPGIIAGEAMEWPEQTITGVWLNDGPADWGNSQGNLAFGVLDDITASEMLRDLEGLRS
jgi:predicted DNA-binding WGR domain protein